MLTKYKLNEKASKQITNQLTISAQSIGWFYAMLTNCTDSCVEVTRQRMGSLCICTVTVPAHVVTPNIFHAFVNTGITACMCFKPDCCIVVIHDYIYLKILYA